MKAGIIARRVRDQPLWVLAVLPLLVGLTASVSLRWSNSASIAIPFSSSDFGNLPLSFEPNVGQVRETKPNSDQSVRFLAHTSDSTIYFTPSGLTLTLNRLGTESEKSVKVGQQPLQQEATSSAAIIRVLFSGANPNLSVEGGNLLPGKVNYLLGNNPAQWHTDLPTYALITYRDLYSGIDLRYEGTNGRLKGTYSVSPGADPTSIRWSYQGAEKVVVDKIGNLHITTANATLVEQAPIAWQELGGQRIPVEVRYAVDVHGSIGFTLGSYDPAYALTIDPTLTYSSYLGGSSYDVGVSIKVDSEGNIYLIGFTSSTNFPSSIPYQPQYGGGTYDAFITKLNASGSALIYSTYLGGSGEDVAVDIAVDDTGNAYVAGRTASANFPLINPYQPLYGGGTYDAFLVKLNSVGSSLTYSTYLGGSGSDQGWRMTIDNEHNVYLTGDTASSNFPVANPYQPTLRGGLDAFVTKLNATGSALGYSTFLGGSGVDAGYGVAVDTLGNAYASGYTLSTNFPLLNPYQATFGGGGDAFITKLSPAGSGLVYSTYLGGSGNDVGETIAVDKDGSAYHTGYTNSNNFPVANAFQATNQGGTDAFVTKLSASGASLVYSTYLGGSSNELCGGIAVDTTGNSYIVGYTASTNFPISNAVQPLFGGIQDAFVAKISATGAALVYSTYLGGTGDDIGNQVAIDGAGTAFIIGGTSSSNFPSVNPYQPNNAGSGDVFISRIGDTPLNTPTPATPTQTATITRTATATNTPTYTATITPTPCTIVFTDLPPNNTFYPFVRCLACRGIVTGYSCGGEGEPCDGQGNPYFRPYSDITRGQIAKIVSNSAGFSEDPLNQIYEDVPTANAFYTWINRLSRRGYMGGYNCGSVPEEPCNPPENRPYFRPFPNATRGQLAKIVSNAAGLEGTPSGIFYTDVQEDNPFYIWIMRLTTLSVMSGYPCGGLNEPCDKANHPYFRPFNTVIRGQASKVVANTFFASCGP